MTVPPILGLSHPACPPGRCGRKYPSSRSSHGSFRAAWHPDPASSSPGWSRPQPTLLWEEAVGLLPGGRVVPGHGPDPRVVALLRLRGVAGEVAGVLRGVPALRDGCPGGSRTIAVGRSARGEQRAGTEPGQGRSPRCPSLLLTRCTPRRSGRRWGSRAPAPTAAGASPSPRRSARTGALAAPHLRAHRAQGGLHSPVPPQPHRDSLLSITPSWVVGGG